MKKSLFGALVLAVLVLAPAQMTFAQTPAPGSAAEQALIQTLQAEIQSLIQQIAALIQQQSQNPTIQSVKTVPISGPSVTITANPSVVQSATQTTLMWASTNATSCNLTSTDQPSKYGSVATSGNLPTYIYGSGTFTLTCTDSQGRSGSASATVTVAPIVSSSSVAPSVDIKANGSDGPISIGPNDSVNLTWQAQPSTSSTLSCYVDSSQGLPDWSGSLPLSGLKTVNPIADWNSIQPDTYSIGYTIHCTDSASGQSASDNVIVVTPSRTASTAAPTVTLTANPTTITSGQSTTLSYSSINATSCKLSTGGGPEYVITPNIIGTIVPVSPVTNTTYILSCSNSSTVGVPPYSSATVTVNSVALSVPTVTLSANPTSITAGQSVSLYATETGATSCTLNGQPTSLGFMSPATVTPTQTTTYTYACSNGAGSSAPQSATVTVIQASVSTTLDPYTSPNYSLTSATSLSSGEKTVQYTYSSNPCGSLMTTYTAPGSVSVGNGPVYTSASGICAPNVPDTSSFRTYACYNSSVNGHIIGTATFAFRCSNQTSNALAGIQNLINTIKTEIGNLH